MGILLKLSCDHTLSRSRSPRKWYNWTLFHFFTHILHQGHTWCRIDQEMADSEHFWVCWKCPKIWQHQKSVGNLRQHFFWTVSRSLDSRVIKFDDFVCPQLYSVQPLCLCQCLYKQPLPHSELACSALHNALHTKFFKFLFGCIFIGPKVSHSGASEVLTFLKDVARRAHGTPNACTCSR